MFDCWVCESDLSNRSIGAVRQERVTFFAQHGCFALTTLVKTGIALDKSMASRLVYKCEEAQALSEVGRWRSKSPGQPPPLFSAISEFGNDDLSAMYHLMLSHYTGSWFTERLWRTKLAGKQTKAGTVFPYYTGPGAEGVVRHAVAAIVCGSLAEMKEACATYQYLLKVHREQIGRVFIYLDRPNTVATEIDADLVRKSLRNQYPTFYIGRLNFGNIAKSKSGHIDSPTRYSPYITSRMPFSTLGLCKRCINVLGDGLCLYCGQANCRPRLCTRSRVVEERRNSRSERSVA